MQLDEKQLTIVLAGGSDQFEISRFTAIVPFDRTLFPAFSRPF